MKTKRHPRPDLTSALLVFACLCACTRSADEAEPVPAGPTLQVVTLAPTASWLVSEVTGSDVELTSLWISEGRELEGEELESLIRADLVVRHGAGLDQWAETLDLDASTIVDLSEGVELIEREGTKHSHGEEGEHAHAEPLTDTWQDAALVLAALDTLEAHLAERSDTALDPAKTAALRQRLAALEADLSRLAEATDATSSEDEMAYLVRRLGQGAGLALSAKDTEGALLLEPLLPPPSDNDYVALLERNVARIAEATQDG